MRRAPDGKRPADAAQIVLLVSLIDYSKCMEKAIAGGTLSVYLEKHVDELNKLINLTMKIDNKEDRQRVMCMITMDTHGRDICMNLIRDKVDQVSNFKWQSQLKPSMREHAVDQLLDRDEGSCVTQVRERKKERKKERKR